MLKHREPIGDMVKLSYSLLIVPAVVVALSSVYYDGEIMSLLYTSNTAHSSDILGILMIGFIGIATTYIFGTLLTANGSLKQLNIMAFSGMALNVALNLILIPQYQAYGSAYSSLVTQLFTGAVQLALAVYILKLKIEWVFIFKLLFFVGAVVLFGWLSEFLSNWVYGYLLMIFVSVIFAFFLGLISLKDLYKIIRYE
jgi:O-antigen/teichoic acid export membrane protein